MNTSSLKVIQLSEQGNKFTAKDRTNKFKITDLRKISEKFPAFYYGLFLFLGCNFYLCSFFSFFAALIFLIIVEKKKVFLLSLIFLFPCAWIPQVASVPECEKMVEGELYIHVVKESRRFGKGWAYQGILKTDQQGRVRCQLLLKERIDAAQVYKVKGRLKCRGGRNFSLRPQEELIPVKKRWTFAEMRFRMKNAVQNYITSNISQKRASLFLTALVIGELDDPLFKKEFQVLGLSHLMAISGFHFALVAFACHLLLRPFFPPKIASMILIFLLTLYFLFLGCTPSIFRAWVFALVTLLGALFDKKNYPINILGISLLIILIFDPLSCSSISFQLTFLATAGILFFYSPIEKWMQNLLPKLSLVEVIRKNLLWQGGYIVLSLLRQSLALTFAVHIPLLPLLLFHFHSFSLNSLFYNLFFPFLTSVSLMLFLLGCIFGSWLHHINGFFTEQILKIPESPPILFKTFYISFFPETALFTWLTATALWGIWTLYKKGSYKQAEA